MGTVVLTMGTVAPTVGTVVLTVHAQYCVAHQHLVALLTLRVEAYSRGTASWRARSPLTAALQFSTHHLPIDVAWNLRAETRPVSIT